jgi:hypothetical protein
MKLSRSIWILLANGSAVFIIYVITMTSLGSSRLDNRNRVLWFQFALRAIVPILGILLEFVGSRFAKWVNVGYFTFVVVVVFRMNFFLVSHFNIHRLFNRSWVFPLAAACVTYFLYSRWWLAPPTPPRRA